ncbi:hypothetical protein HII13_004420 [Brettanomyces bruxellensis]|nr:hypothetical protein HII13_004420 [Brettanomyces bruxellensis]
MSDWEDDIYDDENEEEFSFEEDDSDNEMEDDTQAENVDDVNGNESNSGDGNTEKLDLESLYFTGKMYKEDENYTAALDSFKKLIDLRYDSHYSGNIFIFKAVKQAIKVYEELGENDSILSFLSIFFELVDTVEKAYGDSSMTKLLYRYDRSSNIAPVILQKIYQLFIDHVSNKKLPNTKEHKILIRASLYLANTFVLQGNFDKASALLSKLEKTVGTCATSLKDAFLMDIIASEMALTVRHRFDLDELIRLSGMVEYTKSAIPQSRIIGTIKESSGIIHMYDTEYNEANVCFQDSFKAFNECGDNHRTAVLVKFIISNILSESEINPFKSNDFQGFLSEQRIRILMELYKVVHEVNIDSKGLLKGIKIDWISKFIIKDDKSENVILEKSFDEFTLLQNILNVNEVTIDPEKLISEIDEYKQKIWNYDGNFPLNSSPFELCFSKNGEDFEVNMSHTASDICRDSMITNLTAIPKGIKGNDGNSKTSSGKSYTLETSEATNKKKKLFKLYNDLCVPKGLLQRESLLSKLFVRSLRCDHTKEFQSKEELLTILKSYLGYIRSAIPISAEPKVDHIENIKLKKKQEEYQVLNQENVGESFSRNDATAIDHNIPEVLQSSIMQQMSVTKARSREQDSSKLDLTHLSEQDLRTLKLKMLFEISSNIDAYRIDSLLTSKRGLHIALFDGIPTGSNSEPMSSDSRSISLPYSQNNISKMDTESMESESGDALSDKDDNNRNHL